MSAPSLVEEVFLAALEKSTPEERAAFLDAACKDDPELRRRVERLLEAHPKAGSFLEPPAHPAGEETAAYVPPREQSGAIIAGRYKLVEKIGEGGMGTVWVAQQTEPVKRVVAVKLIKAGMDSSAVLARFEAERQALALMDHPNIARVLDGGATPDGRPFFVMELVKGVPITHFCDARKLTPRQRLELFVPVCQAIQHAHQKGIIHRDIKPSNVLIALYDDRPAPKVIDFGVAKATGQTLTDKSLMTGFGAVVGTPEYMSPEQASLNNLDIDTRSDVYSLGVLLYELLAGSPPFRSDELKKAGLMEMLRVVCEVEPPRPSVKLSTANTRASISADRGTEPTKLTGLLRNELDWIVMKALEKDRSRRYETASGFAADVQRYLAGEAVQAHPPSAVYRLRKFARKHRLALTTAAAFAALLIAAAAVSSWLAVKANRAEAVAEDKRKEAEKNAEVAAANAKEAEKNLNLYGETAAKQAKALGDLAIKAKSLQIDIDRGVVEEDPRSGILQLARTNKEVPENPVFPDLPTGLPGSQATTMFAISQAPELTALREFATVAVLAIGQDYASLLPPFTHDGNQIVTCHVDSGLRRFLTHGEDGTARLWDLRTARPVAILRQEREQVLSCGFSPDGETVFTESRDGVVRFWEAADGAYRAATEPRLEIHPPSVTDRSGWVVSERALPISNGRLITPSLVGHVTKDQADWDKEGLVDLWDTGTGRLVARLDRADRKLPLITFLNGGRWVATTDGNSSVLVFSADDGRLVAKLNHDAKYGSLDREPVLSPSGHIAATVTRIDQDSSVVNYYVHFWDTTSWRLLSTTGLLMGQRVSETGFSLELIADDLFAWTEASTSTPIFRAGNATPIADLTGTVHRVLGDRVLFDSGQLLDTQTGRRLQPPKGRKYHPDIACFAPDGRFIHLGDQWAGFFLDTTLEKSCSHGTGPSYYQASVGWVDSDQRRMPPPDRLNIPPDLLELWAQVAVRGELDAEGRFAKWSEETWERKRQELAAKPAPYPDFPFPGYVAQDKLHWLRAEFNEATTDADKLPIARELLRRCESAGDQVEADRWRAEVDKHVPQSAPPHRSVNP